MKQLSVLASQNGTVCSLGTQPLLKASITLFFARLLLACCTLTHITQVFLNCTFCTNKEVPVVVSPLAAPIVESAHWSIRSAYTTYHRFYVSGDLASSGCPHYVHINTSVKPSTLKTPSVYIPVLDFTYFLLCLLLKYLILSSTLSLSHILCNGLFCVIERGRERNGREQFNDLKYLYPLHMQIVIHYMNLKAQDLSGKYSSVTLNLQG